MTQKLYKSAHLNHLIQEDLNHLLQCSNKWLLPFNIGKCKVLSSVYSPFSNMVGLPPHNTTFPWGINEEYLSKLFYDRMPFLTSTTCVGLNIK